MHLLRIETNVANNDPITPIGMDTDLDDDKVPFNPIDLQCRYVSVNKRLYYQEGTGSSHGYYYIGKKGDYLWFYEADVPWQQTYNGGINAITGVVGSYNITGHVSCVNLKTRVHQWYFMTEHFTDVTLDKLPLDPKNLYAPNRAAGETDGTLLHYSTGAGDPGIILGGNTYFIERWWRASDMDKMSVSYPPMKIAPDHVGKVSEPTGPLEVEMLQMKRIIKEDGSEDTGAASSLRQLVKNHSLQFGGKLGEWYSYGSSDTGHYGYLTTKGDYIWFFEFYGFIYSFPASNVTFAGTAPAANVDISASGHFSFVNLKTNTHKYYYWVGDVAPSIDALPKDDAEVAKLNNGTQPGITPVTASNLTSGYVIGATYTIDKVITREFLRTMQKDPINYNRKGKSGITPVIPHNLKLHYNKEDDQDSRLDVLEEKVDLTLTTSIDNNKDLATKNDKKQNVINSSMMNALTVGVTHLDSSAGLLYPPAIEQDNVKIYNLDASGVKGSQLVPSDEYMNPSNYFYFEVDSNVLNIAGLDEKNIYAFEVNEVKPYKISKPFPGALYDLNFIGESVISSFNLPASSICDGVTFQLSWFLNGRSPFGWDVDVYKNFDFSAKYQNDDGVKFEHNFFGKVNEGYTNTPSNETLATHLKTFTGDNLQKLNNNELLKNRLKILLMNIKLFKIERLAQFGCCNYTLKWLYKLFFDQTGMGIDSSNLWQSNSFLNYDEIFNLFKVEVSEGKTLFESVTSEEFDIQKGEVMLAKHPEVNNRYSHPDIGTNSVYFNMINVSYLHIFAIFVLCTSDVNELSTAQLDKFKTGLKAITFDNSGTAIDISAGLDFTPVVLDDYILENQLLGKLYTQLLSTHPVFLNNLNGHIGDTNKSLMHIPIGVAIFNSILTLFKNVTDYKDNGGTLLTPQEVHSVLQWPSYCTGQMDFNNSSRANTSGSPSYGTSLITNEDKLLLSEITDQIMLSLFTYYEKETSSGKYNLNFAFFDGKASGNLKSMETKLFSEGVEVIDVLKCGC